MRYRTNYEVVTGFNLPMNLSPKPNKVKYAKPTKVNGILCSNIIKETK